MHYENTGERCWSWPELIKEKGNSFDGESKYFH